MEKKMGTNGKSIMQVLYFLKGESPPFTIRFGHILGNFNSGFYPFGRLQFSKHDKIIFISSVIDRISWFAFEFWLCVSCHDRWNKGHHFIIKLSLWDRF